MKTARVRKLALLSVSLSLSMILSYLEGLLPLFPTLPGIKIGLANIAVIFILFRFGKKEAVLVSVLRVILLALLFGNGMTLLYSLSGAALSLTGMLLLVRTARFSETGISVTGGVLHNIGQLLAALLLLKTPELAGYLPVLVISGCLAGMATGLTAALLIRRIPPWDSERKIP